MKYYFKLQFTIVCRKLTALGIPPILAFSIGGVLFYYISNFLFESRKEAPLIYLALAVSLLLKTNNYKKYNFIKAHFSKLNVFKIQFLEKFLMMIPFIIFSVYKTSFLIALIMILVAVAVSFISFRSHNAIYLPTPFSRKPFEFSVGFRKTFYLLPLCYALAIISAKVGNFNLGIFALILIFIITTFNYTKREPDLYIWMHKFTPHEFISFKVKQALINLLLLQSPIILILAFVFPELMGALLFFIVFNMLASSVRVLIKYGISNKNGMNLGDHFTYYLSVLISPFLLILLPYYYKRAIQKLSYLL